MDIAFRAGQHTGNPLPATPFAAAAAEKALCERPVIPSENRVVLPRRWCPPNLWTPMHPKSIRRTHSPNSKPWCWAACAQPGTSVAAVALSHGLNAHVVRKWLSGRGMKPLLVCLYPAGLKQPMVPCNLSCGLTAASPGVPCGFEA